MVVGVAVAVRVGGGVAVGVRVGVRVKVGVRVRVDVLDGVSVLRGVLVIGKVGETGRLVLVGGAPCIVVGVAVDRLALTRINNATRKIALRFKFIASCCLNLRRKLHA